MSIALIRASAEIDMSDDLHAARLLFLLAEADKRAAKTIEGIMKLAKLDFLLRYPNCLERLLIHLDKSTIKADVKPYERTSIESKMIRFRYGPWDARYRRWIGLLVAKGLAITYKKGATIHVGITRSGLELVQVLSAQDEFADFSQRSKLIFSAVGSKSATSLKDLVYKVFPEIVNMKWGEGIKI